MKIKNLTFVEKHIEKIVLAIGLTISAGVVWSFVLTPYGVQMGSELVTPEHLDEPLVDVTTALERAINDPKSPLPPMPVPNYTAGFKVRIERGLTNIPNYDSPLGPPGLDPRVFKVKQLPPPEYLVRTPPKPERLQTRFDFGVLAPGDDKVTQDLAQLVGRSQPPYDFFYTSVMAYFPMDVWRTLLRTAPEANRVPEDLWRGSLFVVDVILERQMWDAAAGRWGDETVVDPIPGMPSFRAQPQSYSHAEAAALVDQVRSEQELITRPPFPSMAGERAWVPPDVKEDKLTPEVQQKLRPLNEKIEQLQKQIAKLTVTAESEPAKAAPAPAPAPAPSPVPGGPGAAMPPRPPAATPQPRPVAGPSRGESELTRLKNELHERVTERDTLLKGGEPKSRVHDPKAAAADSDQIKIWAHDLTVKPGNKYRYRLKTVVLNPLFQRMSLAGEQKKKYFHLAGLAGEPTDWSPEVVIPRPVRYFLTGVDKGNQTITMEVWSIFNGAWRAQDFIVRPGDSIGRKIRMTSSDKKVEAEVDLRMGVLVVDVDFDAPSSNARGIQQDKTVRAIFLDPATNKLYSRSLDEDLSSPDRASLRNAGSGSPVADAR